jgi:hypothetical protein
MTPTEQELALYCHVKTPKINPSPFLLMGLSGYARMDLRLDPRGHVSIREATPNPQIGDGDVALPRQFWMAKQADVQRQRRRWTFSAAW